MRRLIGWIGGAAGGITAYRFLRRRRAEVDAEPAGRAEELREKLAESRAEESTADPVAAAEEPGPAGADEPAAAEAEEPESPDERRRRVHEEGRAAIDEMQSE